MAGLWLLREPFVLIALGPKWADVPIVLAWLAPVGLLQSMISTTGTVFMSTGRTDLLMRLGLLGSVLQVGSFFIGVHWGIEGVAACYLVANLLNGVPHFYYAVRQLHATLIDLVRAVWQPVAFSLIMVALLYPFNAYLLTQGLAAQTVFAAVAAAGVVIYGALTLVFAKALVQDARKMIGMSPT